MDEYATPVSEDPPILELKPRIDAPQGNGNKFQSAISAWRNIDLTTLVTTLDATASDIINYQRDSTVQRKDLAQKTKDFRKLEDSAKLVEYKALLKAYQTFIDLLSNHSKTTNSAFLQVYSSLSEAPDPYPLLEASVDSLLLSEDTLPKVSAENIHLQESVSSLTAQLEETERRLESERTAKKELEDNLQTKLNDVETSWSAVMEEKKDNWESKEKALSDKLESQERLLTEIKATYEVSQRTSIAESTDGESHTGYVTSAELEMVNSDLERTSIRLAEIEARNEQLRFQLAQSASQVVSQNPTSIEDDPAFLRLRSENSALLRKMDAAKVEKDSSVRDINVRLKSFEREVAGLKEERDTLKTKVQKWLDYDDIKQELEVLKSIEFSTGDDDEHDPTITDASKGKNETLEQLLLARNKKLGDELTIMRVSHNDLQARLQSMTDELSTSTAELEKLRQLNSTLESDLSTIQSESANAFPSNQSVAGTYVSRYPQAPSVAPSYYSPRRVSGKTSPTSSIISGFNPRESFNDALPANGGTSSILPMITAQRDRFKAQNTKISSELSESQRTISSLRSEIASLQKDNLNLYEKTRYVSSYNRSVPSSSSNAYATNPNPSTIQMSDDNGKSKAGINLDRYRSAYESNISPFAQFRGRESVRAYKGLSLPERMVFGIARAILSTRWSRNAFAAYCVALHLLVFVSLFWAGGDVNQKVLDVGASVAAGGVAGAAKLGSAGKTDWRPEGFDRNAV